MRAIRPESSLRTMLGPRRPRLRLVLFFVRIWLLNACPALNLPDAVLRNRLAAARLVLILGMAQLLRFDYLLARAVAFATLSILLELSLFKPTRTRAGSTSVLPPRITEAAEFISSLERPSLPSAALRTSENFLPLHPRRYRPGCA